MQSASHVALPFALASIIEKTSRAPFEPGARPSCGLVLSRALSVLRRVALAILRYQWGIDRNFDITTVQSIRRARNDA
jgi:hypothetical protein